MFDSLQCSTGFVSGLFKDVLNAVFAIKKNLHRKGLLETRPLVALIFKQLGLS